MIEFKLDPRSGLAPYLQLVRQVEHAVRLGRLRAGDQLPTVKDVAGELAMNPNTVLKAYRELEHRGLTSGRVGQGTFIAERVTALSDAQLALVRRDLHDWLRAAMRAGLDERDVDALVADGLRQVRAEGAA